VTPNAVTFYVTVVDEIVTGDEVVTEIFDETVTENEGGEMIEETVTEKFDDFNVQKVTEDYKETSSKPDQGPMLQKHFTSVIYEYFCVISFFMSN
jgi:hypothetical protein